jgi:alpha-1,2-mannosyltransferase
MTKLESVPADPTPELIDPTRTGITGGFDDDSQPLLIAWSRPRLVSTGAIALACLVLTILFAALTMIPPYDLGVYQSAGWSMLLGVDPYPPYTPGTDAPFTYPPFAGWLFTPLVPFPEGLLAWLWSFASLALLAWVIRRTLLLAPGLAAQPNGARTTAIVIGSLALATATDPVWDHLAFGQINIALMAACLYDLLGPRDLTRTRTIPQGALIGLAAAVKLTPAIFVIYLLLTRRTRAACVAVASAIGATLAAAIASPGPSRAFFFDLLWRLDARVGLGGFQVTIWNQSIKGALWRLVPDPLVSPLWAVAVLIVGASGMWLARMAWERRGDIAGACATGLVAAMVSPVSWVHHLVWLIPAAVLLMLSTLRSDRLFAGAAIVLLCARTYQLGDIWARHARFWPWDTLGIVPPDSYLLLSVGVVLWLGLSPRHFATPLFTQPERRRATIAA